MLVILIMTYEEEIYIDRLRQVIHKIEKDIQAELKRAPYVVIPIRRIRRELGSIRGIPFIIRVLSRRFKVVRDGNWLIIQPKKEQPSEYIFM